MNMEIDMLMRELEVIRQRLPKDEWDSYAEAIVQERRRSEAHLRSEPPADNLRDLLPKLQSESFVQLPMTLSGVEEIKSHLLQFPVHKGPHTYVDDGRQVPLEQARLAFPLVGYRSDQVLRAPGLVDQLNDPLLLDLIEAYLGCVPTLYSVNSWWSFPAEKPELYYSQYFHRDTDDWRFITLFMYLTEVDAESGPHQVVPGSHTLEGMRRLSPNSWLRRFDVKATFTNSMGAEFAEQCDRHFAGHAADIVGPAGSMFLVNTMALHRGLMPTRNARLLAWARYGLGPTSISADREQGPLARRQVPTTLSDTPRNRYVNRFLFEFDRGPWY
jgi:hypothetical protein